MNEKKKKGVLNGPGFYIALCCCVVAIGLAGYFSSKPANELPQGPEQKAQTKAAPTPDIKLPDITAAPVVTAAPPAATTAPNLDVQSASAQKAAEIPDSEYAGALDDYDVVEAGEPQEFYEGEVVESVSINNDPVFTFPVIGETAEGFSGSTLVYNSAMSDWRTHNGIDILASADTEVKACADGVIEQTYVDSLGNTVVIDHQNGYKSRYSNLDNIDTLTVGTEVASGTVLGKVGTYSLGENTTEPHLHFELIKDGNFVNPADYLVN